MSSTTQEEKATNNQSTNENQKENSVSESEEKPKNKKYRKDKRKAFIFLLDDQSFQIFFTFLKIQVFHFL
jgi:hypothetical protein